MEEPSCLSFICFFFFLNNSGFLKVTAGDEQPASQVLSQLKSLSSALCQVLLSGSDPEPISEGSHPYPRPPGGAAVSTSLDKGAHSQGEPLAPRQPHTSPSFVSVTSETMLRLTRDGLGWVTSSTLVRRRTRHSQSRISRDSKTVPSQAAGRRAYLVKEWAECIVVRLPSW